MSDERRDARLVDAIERPGQDAELDREAQALRAVLARAREALPVEEPPATLDARILAAARVAADEARARHASSGWRRWLRSPALGLALAGGMAAVVAVVIDPSTLRAPTTETASLRDVPPPPAAPDVQAPDTRAPNVRATNAQGAAAEEPVRAPAAAAAEAQPSAGDAPSSAPGVGGLAAAEGPKQERARRGDLAGAGAPRDETSPTVGGATRDEKPAASAVALGRAAPAEAKKASAPPAKEEQAAKDSWGLVADGARTAAGQRATARDDEADAARSAPVLAPAPAPAPAPTKGKADESASAGADTIDSGSAIPRAAPSAAPPRRASSEEGVGALPAPTDAAVAALLAEAAREADAGRPEQAASTLEVAARKSTREPDRGLVALRRAELALALGRPAEARVHAQVAGRSTSPAIVARARVLAARARAVAP